MYSGAKYNAKIYNQRCQRCNSLDKPRLNDSYAEKITYRFKKWSEVKMNKSIHSNFSKSPHQNNLCEKCKKKSLQSTVIKTV